MNIRLFFLRRKARKAEKAVRARLHEVSDIIDSQTKLALEDMAAEARDAAASGTVDSIPPWLKKLPRRVDAVSPKVVTGSMRNILDLIAVVAMVACGIRGIFLQPFQIPTSSMQPTLYGIHELKGDAVPANGLPGAVNRILYSAGRKDGKWQSGGDHLFVDRVSIHLAEPERGDVIVFTTEGIKNYDGTLLTAISGLFYIKRLVGLPGDTLRFTMDGLEVRPAGESEFRHITEFSPVFKKLYSGRGGYQKHTITIAGGRGVYPGRMMQEITVPEDCYYMLGDNVAFSADSRFWGFVPRANIVGRALVVFWPFNRRWGIIDTREPLDVPTGNHNFRTFESMLLQ